MHRNRNVQGVLKNMSSETSQQRSRDPDNLSLPGRVAWLGGVQLNHMLCKLPYSIMIFTFIGIISGFGVLLSHYIVSGVLISSLGAVSLLEMFFFLFPSLLLLAFLPHTLPLFHSSSPPFLHFSAGWFLTHFHLSLFLILPALSLVLTAGVNICAPEEFV